jgi:hypothetical protein
LLAGPRFTFRNVSNAFTPFVHGMVGLSHDKLLQAIDGRYADYPEYNQSYSETVRTHNALGITLGGGLDLDLHENFAIRAIQADYHIANHPKDILPDLGGLESENKRFNNISLSFGFVVRFGK